MEAAQRPTRNEMNNFLKTFMNRSVHHKDQKILLTSIDINIMLSDEINNLTDEIFEESSKFENEVYSIDVVFSYPFNIPHVCPLTFVEKPDFHIFQQYLILPNFL